MVLFFFALPIGAGALLPFLAPFLRRHVGWWATGVAAALFSLALTQVPRIADGRPIEFSFDWVPSLGVRFSFLLDGFSLFFVLLITGMGTLILFYSHEYMAHHQHREKFYGWMLVFTGAMLGLVTASNLIVLYFFWELTTIASFFLIGLSDREEESRWNAVQALVVTTLGSLAMMAGFLLIFTALGTMEIPQIWDRASELRQSFLLVPIVALVLVGVVTKSAIFPFHIWLPSAMVAPTPVSAYLHSATMVTAGVFLVARLTPAFGGVPEWEVPVVVLGMAALIVGGILALRQQDLKALLAYSTVSQLGMMMALYGLGTELAAAAATLHLLSHATFKGAMFLVAGAVEHGTGTRDLRLLGGLAGVMPALAGVAIIAALSSGGIPSLNGFVSKEAILDASLDTSGVGGWVLPLVLVVGSVITLAYSLKFLLGTFFGGPKHASLHSHRPPIGLVISPAVMAGAILALGVYPALMAADLISPAVTAITQQEVHVELALWHGFALPLALSAIVIVAGVAAYPYLGQINNLLSPAAARGTFVQGYQAFVDFMYNTVPRVYWHLQNGNLRVYVVVIILYTFGVVAAGLARAQGPPYSDLFSDVDLGVIDYSLASLLSLAGLVLLFRRGRLEAILNLSLVGLLVAAVFAVYSAPDLAVTQILVELLLAVLFVLGLRHMLRMVNVPFAKTAVTMQALVSLVFGGLVTLLVMAVLVSPQNPSIFPFFIENTETVGRAKNVVNTILIDFRGFDTLGEITVIGLAALAAFAMIRARRERG